MASERPAPELTSSGKQWRPIPVVCVLVVAATIGFGVLLWIQSERARQNPWPFVNVMASMGGYFLCYGMGVLANCYSLRRSIEDLSPDQMIALYRTQRWLGVISTCLVVLGTASSAIWAKTALGRFWDGDLKEVAPLIVCCWQTIVVLTLSRPAPRWFIYSGIIGAMVVTCAWLLPSLYAAVWVIASFQAPALICSAGRSGWFSRLCDRWFRYRARKSMEQYRS